MGLRSSFRRATQAVRRVAQNPLVQTIAPMAIGMPPGSLQLLSNFSGRAAAEAVAEEYAPLASQQFPQASAVLTQARGIRRAMPRRAVVRDDPEEAFEEEEEED